MSVPKRHTILVVDDEPDVVKSVKDLLRLDYRVLGTTRADEAIEILAREEVHIVMSDQRMPEMTGVELLHKVRGQHPDAVRLLFTGYADIRAVIDAINKGNVYRYISKPWDPDELASVIREACERYDLIVERKDLLAELSEKNKTLEKANADLKRSSDLKQAFIQVASHELRTPLTILMGLTHLVTRSPALPEALTDLVRRISNSGQRLNYLVEQILKMLSAGQFARPLVREEADFAQLLNQAMDDVRPFAELRHQRLEATIPGDLGTMSIDVMKVRDSLNHLLLNAIKFTPDGGEITMAARPIAGDGVEIRVSDTGVGIDEQTLVQVFQPFFTGFDVAHHSSGHFEYGKKGLGLGLSVVKAFVEMHGGTVNVESEVGRGTTFTIALPREERGEV